MKNGYQQFFQAAKKAQQQKPTPVERPRQSNEDERELQLRRTLIRNPKRNGVPPRKKVPFPVGAFVGAMVGLAAFAYVSVYPETLDRLLSGVEFRWMGQASAEDQADAEKKTATKATDKAQSAGPQIGSELAEGAPKTSWTQEELNHFSKLNERKQELDLREKELSELEAELQKQKLEIEDRIRKLAEIRQQIATALEEKVEIDKEKVQKLVEFYSNMKPQQAAEIISNLNEDLAIEVLGRMKKKNAADIMNLLEPKKAQTLSEKFAGYQRR